MPSLLQSPHGSIALVELPEDELDAALARLPAGERARAAELSPIRRHDFVAGRTALHAVVGAVEVTISDRNAPLVAGWTCSISHKGTRAAAIAAPEGNGFVGIDLELAAAPKLDITKRVITEREPRVTGAELIRVFAIKEAIYKAIDPIVRRYVGFLEVELIDGAVVSEMPVAVETWSIERDGHWLATARARPLAGR
ncbi:MAG TPA: 4'-phosphopantetheinyl transferase superfamily protein [Kofleriaceae bacterium]|nr:4'-phosphopantetheinyl transferase superfamily protein [Kofleriaceae bacterium]